MVLRPSYRPLVTLLVAAFLATGLSGCIGGDDDVRTQQIPRAVIEVTPVEGEERTFLFDGSASTGKDLDHFWDFGDRSGSDDATVEHTYAGAGVYEVTLTVVDAEGVKDIARLEPELVVGDGKNGVPVADFVPQYRYYGVGEPILVDASRTEDPDGDDITYMWDFNFFMDEGQYLDFRDKKATAEPEEQGGDETVGPAATFPTDDLVERLMGGYTDSPGHGGNDHGIASSSLKDLKAESDEPVFTLDTGVPEEGYYFIRLVAVDSRGASQAFVSEQIWPIHVVADKELRFRSGDDDGRFDAGHQASVQDTTGQYNQEDVYEDHAVVEWPLDRPIETMYVNVSWNGNPTSDAGVTDNDIDIVLHGPDPEWQPRKVQDQDDSGSRTITLKVEGHTDPGKGTWKLELFGRSGVDIEWKMTWWAEVDLNEFRELEAEYIE